MNEEFLKSINPDDIKSVIDTYGREKAQELLKSLETEYLQKQKKPSPTIPDSGIQKPAQAKQGGIPSRQMQTRQAKAQPMTGIQSIISQQQPAQTLMPGSAQGALSEDEYASMGQNMSMNQLPDFKSYLQAMGYQPRSRKNSVLDAILSSVAALGSELSGDEGAARDIYQMYGAREAQDLSNLNDLRGLYAKLQQRTIPQMTSAMSNYEYLQTLPEGQRREFQDVLRAQNPLTQILSARGII